MNIFEQALQLIKSLCFMVGSATCHQISARSFFVGSHQLPHCARCSGFFIGAGVSILYLHFNRRTNGNKPFSLGQAVTFCLGLLPLAFDGLTSYLGLRESNNILRYMTGVLFIYMLPAMVVLVKNFKPEGNNNTPIFYSNWELALIPAISSVFLLLSQIDHIAVYLILALLQAASVCFSLAYFSAMGIRWIFGRLGRHKVKAVYVRALACLAAGGLILLMSGFNRLLFNVLVG